MAESEVFCKGFVGINYKSGWFRILEDSMIAAYLFFNYNCIFVCEIYFSDQWDTLN